jgi:hypothetical protein
VEDCLAAGIEELVAGEEIGFPPIDLSVRGQEVPQVVVVPE